ncbi:enamine deaminase RidA (YjgF/YER057c/UK114 family) [Roseivirga pacifica]|uniref:Enamine deaminase RidA, house cleaning of reactive enamine intermediates, YjgF/YER057c/UK114 family n=1 Tax=Roseivirga pacifica TaxID=1267423 RepID=A0A1I0QSM3_9BACT|nr:RidA family protein [Roseivirga pacifica]RKQ42599.1 enamine deaminase RidA (YjgF/YER057c/UK114 family) [Roseivirga pacifica]SEW30587.1 Enamine deaminase RidA, house cleaning of reactive enamine intermediates, YjgF/YER057c/UK114 family [Roseivirga pacifica]
MDQRTNYSTGSPWEDIVGYSRAVKVGNVIEVTGTVADDKGQLLGGNDPYLQTKFVLEKIKETLEKAGATLEHVVRTRIFVTNIEQWEAIGKAHQEYFGDIKPCTTMVEVSRLIDDKYLVEIEATAIIES